MNQTQKNTALDLFNTPDHYLPQPRELSAPSATPLGTPTAAYQPPPGAACSGEEAAGAGAGRATGNEEAAAAGAAGAGRATGSEEAAVAGAGARRATGSKEAAGAGAGRATGSEDAAAAGSGAGVGRAPSSQDVRSGCARAKLPVFWIAPLEAGGQGLTLVHFVA